MNRYAYEKLKEKINQYEETIVNLNDLRAKYVVSTIRLDNNESPYNSLSDEEQAARKERLKIEYDYLTEYYTKIKEIYGSVQDMFQRREAHGIDNARRASIDEELQNKEKELNEVEKKFSHIKQGKTLDVLSARAFSIDKRAHNFMYAKNVSTNNKIVKWWNSKKDARWNNHVVNVKNRYTTKGLLLYAATRVAASYAAIWFASELAITAAVSAPILGTIATFAAVGYAVKVGSTILSTIYNRVKYGEPRLEPKYDISTGKGSYAKNLEAAKNQKAISDNLYRHYYSIWEKKSSNSQNNLSDETFDLADLMKKIHECDLERQDENYISNTLCPLFDEAQRHEGELHRNIRPKYDRLRALVENYRHDLQQRETRDNAINAIATELRNCVLENTSPNNMRKLFALYTRAVRYNDDFENNTDNEIKLRYGSLKNISEAYIQELNSIVKTIRDLRDNRIRLLSVDKVNLYYKAAKFKDEIESINDIVDAYNQLREDAEMIVTHFGVYHNPDTRLYQPNQQPLPWESPFIPLQGSDSRDSSYQPDQQQMVNSQPSSFRPSSFIPLNPNDSASIDVPSESKPKKTQPRKRLDETITKMHKRFIDLRAKLAADPNNKEAQEEMASLENQFKLLKESMEMLDNAMSDGNGKKGRR